MAPQNTSVQASSAYPRRQQSRQDFALGSLVSDGLKIRGPHCMEYQVCEDWPRRGDVSGEVFRAVARDLSNGQEVPVALKVSKGESAEGRATSIAARAWDQEVRLLRRLALLTYGSAHNKTNALEIYGGGSSVVQSSTAGANTETTWGVRRDDDGPYIIQLLSEFGGVKTLPSLRFMATMPVCWKSLDARIKAVEHGHMEGYTKSQALRWCWQIARGLWALQEVDICYSTFSLRHVLLTQPDGDVRLSGFDTLANEPPITATTAAAAGEWDSRSTVADFGRAMHMTLSCSTDREDDVNYYKTMPHGGGVCSEIFLARIPVAARPIILGLLASKPSSALPLGLALDQLAELIGEDHDRGHNRSRDLRRLEEAWWHLIEREDESDDGGVHETKSTGKASPRETALALAQASLDLGREWERRGKAYKALDFYRDAAQIAGEEIKGDVVAEAWNRMADLHQGKGDHEGAVAILKQMMELYGANVKAAKEFMQATEEESQEPNGLRAAAALHQRVEAVEALATARVRLAASLRALGDTCQAVAHLNTASAELTEVGADQGLAAVRLLIGRASLYSQRGEYPRALDMYEDALEKRRRAANRQDPELACLLVSIAGVYAEKGDTDVALEMLITAYKKMSEIYPDEEEAASDMASPDRLVMAAALERISQLFSKKQQWDDALMCYKAAYERKTAALARAHPDVAIILASMAQIHEKKGDVRAAATLHGRALEIRRASLTPSAPEIAASLYGLGNAHQRLKSSKSALAAYQEAESIRRVNGPSIPLGDILVNMSRPLTSLGRPGEAAEKLRDAREIYILAGVPPTDTRLRTVTENLQALCMSVGEQQQPATVVDTRDRRERLLDYNAARTSSSAAAGNATTAAAAVPQKKNEALRQKKGGGCAMQ